MGPPVFTVTNSKGYWYFINMSDASIVRPMVFTAIFQVLKISFRKQVLLFSMVILIFQKGSRKENESSYVSRILD